MLKYVLQFKIRIYVHLLTVPKSNYESPIYLYTADFVCFALISYV